MLIRALILAISALGALGSPIEERDSCPCVHVFGARETTVSAGFGSAGPVVNSILAVHSGATSEAIVYPACGGQPTCGGVAYADSVKQGTAAVINAISTFAKKCPKSAIVFVGYSQGGELGNAALCGATGTDGSLDGYNIKAMIWMGDPRFKAGAPYNVGTCNSGGFDARAGSCGEYNDIIQSYCDITDPYCCRGKNTSTHQGYAKEYGAQALAFVNSKL